MLPSSQIRDITLKDYAVILRRRAWVIVACFSILTCWSALQAVKKIPLYQATAKILIEKTSPRISPVQSVYAPAWVDKEYIQSQISILTSRTLAKKTVEGLIGAGDTTFAGIDKPERAFLGGLSVTQQLGTQIINIGYTSRDPIKAAKFANALTNAYIQGEIQKKAEVGRYATSSLEAQLAEMRKKLQDSESALNEYVKKNDIVSLPDVEKRTSSILEGLKQEKVNIENELAELSKRYKSKHPKIVALDTRFNAVNNGIADETEKLFVINEKMVSYNNLKREMESNKSLYDSLLKKTKETEVDKEFETTNIRIVDLADIPRAPFSPNRILDIFMGAIFGLLLGIGLALSLEYLDSTVKTTEDIETYVRLPFLGYVPSARSEAKSDKVKDIDLICQKMPSSRVAEAYRSIRTSVIFSAPEDKPLKTILITSTSPQEGKTTVVINLGIVFAQANENILIIESDMRRPRITSSLGLDNKEGLSSFLAGTSALDAVIKQTSIPHLSLIASGPRPPNPTELLTSAKTRSLLEELKARFDRIIIDSPPVLTVADTTILANISDGVIDVIRAGALNIDIILRGKQHLAEAKARIIGVILNNVNVKKEDSYYYYHYYYAQDQDKEKKA